MNRHLQRLTTADVSDELVHERAQVELDKLLEDVRAGYVEAIEFVHDLAHNSGSETYAQLEKEIRTSLELVERDAILWEMEAAQDAYVSRLVEARSFA